MVVSSFFSANTNNAVMNIFVLASLSMYKSNNRLFREINPCSKTIKKSKGIINTQLRGVTAEDGGVHVTREGYAGN